jgi:hypothetical protein
MATRHICLACLTAFGFAAFTSLAMVPRCARAQEESGEALPQVDNAKHQFIGRVTSNSVFVRSGPSNTSFYPTMKLDKDQRVTVVGIKHDWLKIVPPPGSFSYVPQVYVTRRGDGKIGRVNSSLNVRAGSSLNPMKTTLQVKLEEGQDVTIIGELDEYYKIVPPEGAYLYVHQRDVEPLGPVIDKATQRKTPDQQVGPVERDLTKPTEPDVAAPAETDKPLLTETPSETDTTPTTKGSDTGESGTAATTRPAAAAVALEEFSALEADFASASKLPVIEQPVAQLIERYGKLQKSGAMTGLNKQIVDARLKALEMRSEAREKLVQFRQSQEKMRERRRDLAAEKLDIDERVKQTQVTLYTAVGTLRMSSLQQGNATLYRLTDPTTQRTVVYLRSNDPKYASLLNQFVGVRGDLVSDERNRMKVITPTEAEPVDASKVNSTVIATITPPGMLLPSSAATDQREAGN